MLLALWIGLRSSAACKCLCTPFAARPAPVEYFSWFESFRGSTFASHGWFFSYANKTNAIDTPYSNIPCNERTKQRYLSNKQYGGKADEFVKCYDTSRLKVAHWSGVIIWKYFLAATNHLLCNTGISGRRHNLINYLRWKQFRRFVCFFSAILHIPAKSLICTAERKQMKSFARMLEIFLRTIIILRRNAKSVCVPLTWPTHFNYSCLE